MSPTEQAQRLAEEKYPLVDEKDHNDRSLSYFLYKSIIQGQRKLFVEIFTTTRWIEVTPDSMPGESGWYVVWHQKWTNWTRLYYDKSDNTWSNGTSKNIDLSQLNCPSYFQIIESPKPSKQ